MHEYAVTKSLIKTCIDEAEKAGANKITEIRLVIGDLSTIIDESVQMYFDIMAEGTIAYGSKLVFKRIPAQFKCRSCGSLYNKPAKGYDCPVCGDYGLPTGVGREFYIDSIEVE
ncbi:MAG: hydrogenase maturation nickel metallochaperone HypA [Clostridiaceae bacterium]|nr:hydrogenase maturation nickel metallochaperone HypA [Clostridiaceae bacterium]